MSNYNKATNFAVKDTLTSGDPDKVVSGAEIDNEFNAIASAVTSKADKVPASTTNNLAALDANGNLKDSGASIVSVAPPVGSITMYGGTSVPNGWLECDGSNVSRLTQSDLFNAIGTTFGAGDGSTTFGLPDLRGEFVRGWDNGRGVDSGRSFGSFQDHSLEDHFHDVSVRSSQPFITGTGSSHALSSGIVSTTSPLGANVSDETRPRNIALMYIIKT